MIVVARLLLPPPPPGREAAAVCDGCEEAPHTSALVRACYKLDRVGVVRRINIFINYFVFIGYS